MRSFSKRVDTVRKRVRHFHVSILAPKVAVVSFSHMIVQDDEVANPLDLITCFVIVLIDQRLRDAAKRKKMNESAHTGDDEVNARGLQRLYEAARQAERNNVFIPHSASVA